MKIKQLFTLALAGLLITNLLTTFWAKPPKMKMTTLFKESKINIWPISLGQSN